MNDPLMNTQPQQPQNEPVPVAAPVSQTISPTETVPLEATPVVTESPTAFPWKKVLLWSALLNGILLLLGTGFTYLFAVLWGLLAPPDGLAGIFLGMVVVSSAGPAVAGIITVLLGFWIFKKMGLRLSFLFVFALLIVASGILATISALNPLSTGTFALTQLVGEGNFVAASIVVILSLVAGVAGGAFTAWVMYSLKGRMAVWARVAIFILALVALQIILAMIVVSQG